MFQKRINSIKYAINGIIYLVRTQVNAKLHLCAIVFASVLGITFKINAMEWISLVFCFGMVLSAEALNTALECLTDLVSPNYHPLAGKAKDVAAGAVLILAIASIIVGMIIFIPKMLA